MIDSPWLGGSQTRVCDTGPQFTPFSLFRCGSQRYGAIRTSWRERDARDLRLRLHQPPQSLRTVCPHLSSKKLLTQKALTGFWAVCPACGNRPAFLIVVDQRSEPGLAARHGEGPIFGLMAAKFYEPRSPTSFHASTFSSSIHPRWIMKRTWNVRFSSAAESPTTKGITSFFKSRRSTRIFATTYWRMS